MVELRPKGFAAKLTQAHLGLMTGGAVFMIPWTIYLGFTLPQNYTVRDWPLTWLGFDSLLVVFMAATAILTWLHRQLLVLPAFTTGILLLCDAWFDVTTASSGELAKCGGNGSAGSAPPGIRSHWRRDEFDAPEREPAVAAGSRPVPVAVAAA